MTDLLKFSVPGKPEYVGMIRLAISTLANNAGFDIEAVEDIKVAVSEACSNATCHCGEALNYYDVFCELTDDKMVISVLDHTGDLDVPSCPLSGIKDRGLSTFIIKALMDEVDVLSELGIGTKIKMVKFLRL